MLCGIVQAQMAKTKEKMASSNANYRTILLVTGTVMPLVSSGLMKATLSFRVVFAFLGSLLVRC